MRHVVELVGLPGSGKSTIARALIRSGKFTPLRKVMRRAVGQWITTEVWRVGFGAFLLGNEVSLRLYFARSIANLRDSYKANPHVMRLVAEFVLEAGCEEAPHELRFSEAMATFFELLSRDHLLTSYAAGHTDPVLADEHWIQLIAFVLNWGNESRWTSWSTQMLDHINLPETIIWLQGGAETCHSRQLGRGRIAAIFHGIEDIATKASSLEHRANMLQSELVKRGVTVVAVDANHAPEKALEAVLAAL